MNENYKIECMECFEKLDSRLLQPLFIKVKINEVLYKATCFECPKCKKISIVNIDNDTTYKVVKDLQKSNMKIDTYYANGSKPPKKVIIQNTKLRYKLSVLRGVLYNKLIGQNYQLLDQKDNEVQTGIFKFTESNIG